MKIRFRHVALTVLCAFPFALSAAGFTIPNTFSNGAVADAAQMNGNFAALAGAVNTLSDTVDANATRLPATTSVGKIRVHSGGGNAPFGAGRFVHTNGTNLSVNGCRGLDVLRLNKTTLAKVGEGCFDTYDGTGTAAFITYLNAIPTTEIVVVSASDAWTENTTAAAHDALRRCGARRSQEGAHRYSYFLVGTCGDGASGYERIADSVRGPLEATILVLDGEIIGR